jgi:hypothetical protein
MIRHTDILSSILIGTTGKIVRGDRRDGVGEEEETEKKFTGLAVPPEAHTAGSWQRMLGHSASATS